MPNKRFFENPKITEYDNVAIPLTNLNDKNDYFANVAELQKLVMQGGSLADYWSMKPEVLPTCRSFRDPEYLKAGVYFFEDISNTEDKPDKLKTKKVQFARLLCEAGRSETEGLNFVKQYLFYVNMTDQELELSMRGVLLNGNNEVQGATPWKTGVDEADHAKNAESAVLLSAEAIAGKDLSIDDLLGAGQTGRTYTGNGAEFIGGNLPQGTETADFVLEILPANNKTIQRLTAYIPGGPGVYLRQFNGSWGTWVKIMTEPA